jgi:hypothetical protein
MLHAAQQLHFGFTTRSPANLHLFYRQGALDVSRGLYAEAKVRLEQMMDAAQLHVACKNILYCSVMTEIAFAALGLRHIGEAKDALAMCKAGLATSEAQLAGNASEKHRQAILKYVASKAGKHSRVMRLFFEKIIPHAWLHQKRDALHPVRERLQLLEAHVLLQTLHIAKATQVFERITHIYAGDDNLSNRTSSRHPVIADCCSGLALCAFACGEYAKAESLFIKAKEGKFAGGWEATCTSMAVDAEGLASLAVLFARYMHNACFIYDAS